MEADCKSTLQGHRPCSYRVPCSWSIERRTTISRSLMIFLLSWRRRSVVSMVHPQRPGLEENSRKSEEAALQMSVRCWLGKTDWFIQCQKNESLLGILLRACRTSGEVSAVVVPVVVLGSEDKGSQPPVFLLLEQPSRFQEISPHTDRRKWHRLQSQIC